MLEDNFKTQDERREASKNIIKQMNDLELTIRFEPVRQLMKLLNMYIKEGRRIEVNIPWPDINRRIRGVLATGKREDTYVMLKHEKF